MNPIRTFLKAVERLARNGDISIDDACRFAKQQFGEVSDLMKLQINKLFKQKQAPGIKRQKEGEVIDVSFKPGRDKKGNVVEESPSQKARREEGITFSVPEKGIFNQKTSIDEVTQMLTKNPFRPGGGLDQVTGVTRGLARKILDRKGIDIGKNDPIDVFTDTFGESITDVKNLAEEIVEAEETGRKLKSADELLEIEGLYDIKIPKNPNKGITDEELLNKMEEVEAEDVLKKFDPEDREPNAMGGINRTNFATGGIKLIGFLARKGKDLKDEITKAINNFMQRSGDNKLDADVILDDMLEELGTDRDAIDQKDVIDAYGQIYDNLTADTATAEFLRPKKRSFKGTEIKDPKFDENMPFDNDAEKLAEIKMSNENFDLEQGLDDLDNLNLGSKQGNIVSKQLKVMRLAEQIQPGLFEKLNDTQLDIIVKYGDMIDDNLLKQIVLDPDPNNQAAALATIEEAKIMLDKGMSVDEVLQAQGEALKRKKNAEGGLNYLMGF